MTCGIYLITCGKRPYVGQSINIEDRWKHHLALLKRGVHPNPILQNTWHRHGSAAFSISILEECCRDALSEREHAWCVRLGSYRTGCNVATVIRNHAYVRHHTVKSKAHLSRVMRNRTDDKRRFTADDVIDVWSRYMDGESCTSIADAYKVNNKTVWFIVTRRYYREIELPPSCRRKERRRPGGGRKKRDKSGSTELFRAAGVPVSV